MSCTLHDILRQIGIPFDPHTSIQCMTSPSPNIDYFVALGGNLTEMPSDVIATAENSIRIHQEQLDNQESQQTISVQQQQQVVPLNQPPVLLTPYLLQQQIQPANPNFNQLPVLQTFSVQNIHGLGNYQVNLTRSLRN